MNRRDLEELLRQRHSAFDQRGETRRLVEESERQKRLLGVDRMVDSLPRISEAEKRMLFGGANNARERLLIGAAFEPRDARTYAEQAFVKMRAMENDALKYRSGVDLYRHLERESRAAREAMLGSTKLAGIERHLFGADKEWERMLGSPAWTTRAGMLNPAREAAAAYSSSTGILANRIRGEEPTAAPDATYIRRLFEPTDYHARFTRETFDRLTSPHIAAREALALRGSMTLFNDQIVRLTAAVTALVVPRPAVSPPHSGRIYPSPGEFNLPTAQQNELLGQDEVPADADYEELAPLAPSSSVADDAIDCIVLYERCNDACQFNGRKLIFTPTTRGTVAAGRVCMTVADTQDRFDLFIDQLYMLFYEGAGGQKIKLLREHGGVMDRPECEALWDIKQLRSKRSRHDIDHGSDGEIRRKYRELKAMYERLGLYRFPQTPEEYKRLQQTVLRNLRSFLAEVAGRIESEGSAPGLTDNE